MTATSWSEVPPIQVRSRRLPPLVTGTALVAWVGIAGALVRAMRLPAGDPWLVALVGTAMTVALVLTRRMGWLVRWIVGASTAVVLLLPQGELVALWVAWGGLLGAWVGLGAPPLPRVHEPHRAQVAVVTVLAGVAAWRGAEPSATWQPLLPLAMASLLVLLGPVVGDRMHRAGAWLGGAVGSAVSAVVFTLLGLVAVVVPWSVRRLLGLDPLGTRQGWVARDALPVGAGRPWSEDPATHRVPLVQRARRPLALLVLAGIVAGVVVGVRRARDHQDEAMALTVDAPRGLQDAAWYAELRRDQAWALDERVALRPFEVFPVQDVETRHLNVHEGYRDTWRAPACACRRLKVWIYGGTAMFGLEQRDDHTIASAVAQLAYRDGLTVDVSNRGLPGQLHFRNASRFLWDLQWRDAPPDLVLFYDGAHEVDAAIKLSAEGLGDTRRPYAPFVEDRWAELLKVEHDMGGKLAIEGWSTVSDLPNDDPGRLAVARYDRTRRMSRDAAATADVPVRWFWQPTFHAHAAAEPRPPAGSDAAGRGRAKAFARASSLIDDEVVDLTHVFDEVDEAVFADEANISERGALVVAEAIYAEIEPQLRSLAEEGGS